MLLNSHQCLNTFLFFKINVMSVHVCACIMCMHLCVGVCLSMYACMFMCVCPSMHVCVCVRVCVCVCVCVCPSRRDSPETLSVASVTIPCILVKLSQHNLQGICSHQLQFLPESFHTRKSCLRLSQVVQHIMYLFNFIYLLLISQLLGPQALGLFLRRPSVFL